MTTLANLEQTVLESPEVKSALRNIEDKGEKEAALAAAAEYVKKIKPNKVPQVMAFSKWLSSIYVSHAFSNVETRGLEKVIEELRGGGVALFSSHFSMLEIAVIFDLFAKQQLDNVFYVGGINLAGTPVLGPMLIDPLLRNSGAVLIERSAEYGTKLRVVMGAVVEASMGYLLDEQNNVVNFIGDGRHKTGTVGNLKSAVAKSAARHAKSVMAFAVGYDVVPEDRHFAENYVQIEDGRNDKAAVDTEEGVSNGADLRPRGKKGKGSTLFDGLAKLRMDGGYGTVHVAFDYPIHAVDHPEDARQYRTGKEVSHRQLREFRDAMRIRVVRNITVTPVNVLCAMIVAHGLNRAGTIFTPVQIAELSKEPLRETCDSGAQVSERLTTQDLAEAFYFAATKLAERGAVEVHSEAAKAPGTEFRIIEPRLHKYYSNTITPTLQTFGIKL